MDFIVYLKCVRFKNAKKGKLYNVYVIVREPFEKEICGFASPKQQMLYINYVQKSLENNFLNCEFMEKSVFCDEKPLKRASLSLSFSLLLWLKH